EEYSSYIKITADIVQKIIAVGGQFHADAEEVLTSKYGSVSKNIWGGGYSIKRKDFETNALLNIKPGINESSEILDSNKRNDFLNLVKEKLSMEQRIVLSIDANKALENTIKKNQYIIKIPVGVDEFIYTKFDTEENIHSIKVENSEIKVAIRVL
ncbi:hypothetical protein GW891_03710, partial [bacterium]|nr:hypothetical protein [bacterium]